MEEKNIKDIENIIEQVDAVDKIKDILLRKSIIGTKKWLISMAHVVNICWYDTVLALRVYWLNRLLQKISSVEVMPAWT